MALKTIHRNEEQIQGRTTTKVNYGTSVDIFCIKISVNREQEYRINKCKLSVSLCHFN